MSAIIGLYFKRSAVEKMLEKMNQENLNGLGIDVMINDTQDTYGNNVSAMFAQSKEQREAKEKRDYIGNGKVRYVSNTGIAKAEL